MSDPTSPLGNCESPFAGHLSPHSERGDCRYWTPARPDPTSPEIPDGLVTKVEAELRNIAIEGGVNVREAAARIVRVVVSEARFPISGSYSDPAIIRAFGALNDLRYALADIHHPHPAYAHGTEPTAADNLGQLLAMIEHGLHQVHVYLWERPMTSPVDEARMLRQEVDRLTALLAEARAEIARWQQTTPMPDERQSIEELTRELAEAWEREAGWRPT